MGSLRRCQRLACFYKPANDQQHQLRHTTKYRLALVYKHRYMGIVLRDEVNFMASVLRQEK